MFLIQPVLFSKLGKGKKILAEKKAKDAAGTLQDSTDGVVITFMKLLKVKGNKFGLHPSEVTLISSQIFAKYFRLNQNIRKVFRSPE